MTSNRSRSWTRRCADTGLLGDTPGLNIAESYQVGAYNIKKTVAGRRALPYHCAMANCFACGHPLPSRERIFRSTLCEECGADAHVCLNCDFYLPGAHWDCRETIDEQVRDKDRANFCDYFSLSKTTSGGATDGGGKAEDARKNFQNLFGDG